MQNKIQAVSEGAGQYAQPPGKYPGLVRAVEAGRFPVCQYGNETISNRPDLNRERLSVFALHVLEKGLDCDVSELHILARDLYSGLRGVYWGSFFPAICFEIGRRKGIHDERQRRKRSTGKAVTV